MRSVVIAVPRTPDDSARRSAPPTHFAARRITRIRAVSLEPPAASSLISSDINVKSGTYVSLPATPLAGEITSRIRLLAQLNQGFFNDPSILMLQAAFIRGMSDVSRHYTREG
jgi:hypothetical protein